VKKYQIIYADPPWELKAGPHSLHDKNERSRPLVYPTMSLEDIKWLNVPSIIATDSVLFLWTTNKYIEQSYSIARAWGFTPSTMLVWCKKPKGRGLGGTFGISTEYLLFARRGSLKAKERHWSTWFEAKRGLHSQKPSIARALIEKCFSGEKLELFAREKSLGWDVWGNEVQSDISLPADNLSESTILEKTNSEST
jgi:N6-adenosine-specific RNA methylase IME4